MAPGKTCEQLTWQAVDEARAELLLQPRQLYFMTMNKSQPHILLLPAAA